jgi:hypothetical protein
VYYPDNGRYYAMGGRNSDTAGSDLRNPREYNLATNSWVVKGAMYPDADINNMAGAVLNMGGTNYIVTVGGSAGGGTTATGRVTQYNPVTDVMTHITTDPWTPGTANILPGGWSVHNNKLYIFGGFEINVGMTTAIWEFDPARAAGARWVQKSGVLPVALGYIPTTTIGNFIYMAGGAEWDGTTLIDSTASHRYDPATDTVTTIPSIPRATGETRALTMGGTMWVLGGGRNAPNPSNEVNVYNPGTNAWTLGPAFMTARRNFMAATDGSNIVISGGYAPTAATDNTEVYRAAQLCVTPTVGQPSATSTGGVATSTRTGSPVPPTSTRTGTVTGGTATAMPTSTPCTITFSDVPTTHTFYSFIRCLACRGIISGYADGTFRPGNNITRGQIAKMVSNAAGFNEPATGQTFEDVPPSNTFYVWIQRLATRNIMSGYPCGGVNEPCGPGSRPYFRWQLDATRGQLSKIVSEAAGFNEPIPATQQTFEDVPPSNPFWVWIERLAARGVITGYPCGGTGEPCGPGSRPYFRWGFNVTRGQASKIVAESFYPGCNTPR